MTTKELIARLQALDPEGSALVVIDDPDTNWLIYVEQASRPSEAGGAVVIETGGYGPGVYRS